MSMVEDFEIDIMLGHRERQKRSEKEVYRNRRILYRILQRTVEWG